MEERASLDADAATASASHPPSPARQDADPERIAAYTTVREDVAGLVPHEATRILDVGCSNGALGRALKSRREGRQVIGIEIDAALAADARRVLDVVVHADLETLDVEGTLGVLGPFDCIVCADVLEHVRDPWRIVDELVRMLSGEGTLVIALPNIRHHSALAMIALSGRFPRRARGIFDGTHLRWFTWAESVALLRGAGLDIDAVDCAIRIGDRGGGLLNRAANRMLGPFARTPPVREFFAYQFAIRGRRAPRPSG